MHPNTSPHTADAPQESAETTALLRAQHWWPALQTDLSQGDLSKEAAESCYEASLLHGEEDYLKRHKSLQMEGQKLINQSLVMGIEVGKSSATNQNTEKVLPQV